jgi:hypothetical protein
MTKTLSAIAGPALDGELQVDEADDVEREGELAGVGAEGVERGGREIDGGQDAGGVAGVDAGFFDVLHDAGDDNIFESQSASTSTSTASSRKWSTRMGRSCEYSTASFM